MTTKTSTATEPGQDMTVEKKINQMRELFARPCLRRPCGGRLGGESGG